VLAAGALAALPLAAPAAAAPAAPPPDGLSWRASAGLADDPSAPASVATAPVVRPATDLDDGVGIGLLDLGVGAGLVLGVTVVVHLANRIVVGSAETDHSPAPH